MAWWQKKLLRYALSRTGLLDDKVLDLDKLDIALGKKNVVELKDVGLNIERIAKLAQLPPSLRIEAARVLLLRLTVPADIYRSSIMAEVDGVELSLRLDEKNNVSVQEQGSRDRAPASSRNPQHRKVHRRIHSPAPHDPGGSAGYDELRIPTTDELARSFLLEEPVQNRRQLEASVVAGDKGLEESTVSESSEGAAVGTGAAIGLPGFLSDFLQGIVDRLQVSVRNVEAKLHTEISGSDELAVPVTLHLHVGGANLGAVPSKDSGKDDTQAPAKSGKRIDLTEISLSLVTDAAFFSELSEMPSNLSPTESKQQNRSPELSKAVPSAHASSSLGKLSKSSTHVSSNSSGTNKFEPTLPVSDPMRESTLTLDDDRFADAGDDDLQGETHTSNADLEIQPGDDNITWGSRRSKSSAPVQDLWSSQVFEDAMPESLLLPPSSKSKVQPPTKPMPRAAQTRRDVSPFGRNFQSPGSWPRLDESPHRERYPSGPGSWPALDQSQQSLYQPLTSDSMSSVGDDVDNKQAALEASTTEPDEFGTPPEEAAEGPDALATSMFFTHEEAKSMYASAMAHSSKIHVPGGWASEDDQSESPPTSIDVQSPVPEPSAGLNEDEDLAYGEQPFNTPGNATPRAPTPDLPKASSVEKINDVKKASRQLLLIDRISILIPAGPGESNIAETSESIPSPETRPGRKQPHMPGTFSMYSEMSASRRSPPHFAKPDSSALMSPPRNAQATEKSSPLIVEIGVVKGQLDMSCGRLIYRLASNASAVLGGDAKPQPASGKSRDAASVDLSISVSIADMWLAFKESSTNGVSQNNFSEPIENLVTIGCRGFELSTSAENTGVRLGSFATFLGPSRFLSFNRSQDMTTSIIISDQTPDIVVNVAHKSTEKRPVIEVAIEMVPLDLVIDLPMLEETFDPFGGLSGLLEAGNSMLSESGMASSPSSPKLAKGVRFDDSTEPSDTAVNLKMNMRLAGARALLRGSGSSVQLQATTFRAIYREYGVSATVSHVSVTGPYLAETNTASMAINLSTLRVEYLENAQNSDVERLLALLTPAHDKYDNDDDILLDTLIRQRKKGGIIRASLDGVKFKCEDLDWLAPLSTLGGELSKLSAVTKYLPEDERPGILSFVHVKTLEARMPVNPRFGTLNIASSDIQFAHVGLPALLAFSIGHVKALQSDQAALIHSLVPLSVAENLPMVMGRMLGDEAEPATKIKLFNVCVEYSVSTLLNLTGLDEHVDTEEIVAELAKSVANLADARKASFSNSMLAASDASNDSVKRVKIDLIIHDSAIGLSPRDLPSKGLLVLTDAHVSTVVPPADTAMVQLDFRKAGFFVADEFVPDGINSPIGTRGSPGNPSTKPKLTLALSKHGYVSVGSVMAAQILVHVSESDAGTDKTVDVKVRNELLLLETCADSTQTLIAISNGLAPPKGPSKQPKYLTEPMTIKDMMASFTGEAFEKPARRPNTLFDVDEEPEEDSALLNHPTVGDDDEDGLLAESEMMDSLYGPVSGILGIADPPEESVDGDESSETAESLLEDDPFEMTIAPADFRLSDAALLKELNNQAKPAISAVAVELHAYEPADRGLNVADFRQRGFDAKSDRHTGSDKANPKIEARDVPFKLSLRDLHIIWNIYDGYDWQRTREGITQAVEQVETKAEERRQRLRQPAIERDEEESVIGDFLFNSIYIGIPSNHDTQDLRRQINRGIDDLASETESVPMSGISKTTTAYSASGRALHQRPRKRLKLERSKGHKVAFELKGVSADILVYPEDSADLVSSVDVRVKQLEIFDNVPTSTWRKFLTHLSNEPGGREMSKPMLHLELLNVRTLENFAASEITMHVSVLPLRLHVDQDALDFIMRFFEFKDDTVPAPDPAGEQPFIQRLEVDTVDLRLDYKPKKVDYGGLRSGHTTEFMNFIILEGANIRLKHAIIYGIKGFEPLHKTLNDIWMPDVKRNQLPTVLAGLAPVRSLVNIGSGVRDVVAIPVREYQKDGRIVRSVQKGAFEFGKTTASELARLGAKVAIGTQTLLKGAEGLLTPTTASPGRASPSRRYSSDQAWQDADSPDEDQEARAISAYANQPLSVLSGLLSARKHLEYDLATARDALIAVQGEVLESAGPGAAAAAVAKYAPTVILRPIIGTSRAVGTALLGVGNQIDRSNVQRLEDKYKRR